MVDYTLTLATVPTGVEANVKALGLVQWIVTNKTLTFASGTSIDVLVPDFIGEALGSPDLAWRFVKWENDSKDVKRTLTLTGNTTITATYELQEYFPTRHYEDRQNKYEGKIDEEVMYSRTSALKTMMVEQVTNVYANQALMESKVGKYLNSLGLYGTELHHYRNFSQELFRLQRLFTSSTLEKEASLRGQKWKDRGLDATYLQGVANLFNIKLTLT